MAGYNPPPKGTLLEYDYMFNPQIFAKICGALIAIFFLLVLVTGLFSCLARRRATKFCCITSVIYFAIITIYIMVGMILSFEVARKRYDRQN